MTGAGVALGVVLALTLRPAETASDRAFGWCIGCGELGTLDVLLNLALFVPFGAIICLLRPSAARAIAWAAAASLLLSVAIEISQLLVIRGRDPSLSDIVANTLGGGVGAIVAVVGPRIGRASRSTWHRLTWCWVLLSASVLAFGAWAVGLDVPREHYYVQWVPLRASYAPFRGQLSTLSLNGLTMKPGEVVPPARLPPLFFEGRVTIEGIFTPGAEPDGIALIARLALASGEFLMIGQQRDALVARYRANAHRAGLRSPIFALEGVLRPQASAAARVRVATRRGEVELRAARGSSVRLARHRVSAARLWAMLLPFEHAFGRFALMGDLLWLGLVFGPAAYGGARSRVGWRGVVPVGVLTAWLALLALVWHPALWWWPFWAAVASATAAAYSLGTRARLGAEKSPAHSARPLVEDVLTVRGAEEA